MGKIYKRSDMRDDSEVCLFFKCMPCTKEYNHDWAACFNTHPAEGDKAKRRCLLAQSYSSKLCPDMKNTGKCPRGDACTMSHTMFEYWLHPMRYKTKLCKNMANCNRPFCFFAHSEAELRQPTEPPTPLPSFASMMAAHNTATPSSGPGCSSSDAAALAANSFAGIPAGMPPLMPQVLPQVLPQQQQQQQDVFSPGMNDLSGVLTSLSLAEGSNGGSNGSSSPSAATGGNSNNSSSSSNAQAVSAFPAAAVSSALAAYYGPAGADNMWAADGIGSFNLTSRASASGPLQAVLPVVSAAAAASPSPMVSLNDQEQQQQQALMDQLLLASTDAGLTALLHQAGLFDAAAGTAGPCDTSTTADQVHSWQQLGSASSPRPAAAGGGGVMQPPPPPPRARPAAVGVTPQLLPMGCLDQAVQVHAGPARGGNPSPNAAFITQLLLHQQGLTAPGQGSSLMMSPQQQQQQQQLVPLMPGSLAGSVMSQGRRSMELLPSGSYSPGRLDTSLQGYPMPNQALNLQQGVATPGGGADFSLGMPLSMPPGRPAFAVLPMAPSGISTDACQFGQM